MGKGKRQKLSREGAQTPSANITSSSEATETPVEMAYEAALSSNQRPLTHPESPANDFTADRTVESPADPIYVHHSTRDCAKGGCVPCLYKLFPNGRMELPPNQRPEQCPRHSQQNRLNKRPRNGYSGSHGDLGGKDVVMDYVRSIGLYTENRSYLTVGDGDFSFSLSLAKTLINPSESQGSRTRIFATSYESLESLLSIYPKVEDTLTALRLLDKSVKVLHSIDATKLSKYFSLKQKKGQRKGKKLPVDPSEVEVEAIPSPFDVIIWNFPCVAVPDGKDGQASEIELNRKMLSEFFEACKDLLLPVSEDGNPAGGEIHITHKTFEPFSWWRVEELALAYGWRLQGKFVFDRCLYSGYFNRKAMDRKSFPCHDARTLVFTRVEGSGPCRTFIDVSLVCFEEIDIF